MMQTDRDEQRARQLLRDGARELKKIYDAYPDGCLPIDEYEQTWHALLDDIEQAQQAGIAETIEFRDTMFEKYKTFAALHGNFYYPTISGNIDRAFADELMQHKRRCMEANDDPHQFTDAKHKEVIEATHEIRLRNAERIARNKRL
jgi:hypothetical protein